MKNVYEFEIGSAWTRLLRGDKKLVKRCLRVLKDDKYSKAYASGMSFVNFYSETHDEFPTGLLDHVTSFLRSNVDDLNIRTIKNYTITDLSPISEDMLDGILLRNYQVDTANLALARQRGTLIAATGSGKTVILMAILSELSFRKLKTLIIVPTTNILLNTVNKIKKHMGIDVGMYGDKFKIIKDVTVITNQSLDAYSRTTNYKSKLPINEAKVTLKRHDELREYVKSCDAIIVDEVHLSTAPAWYNACMMCNGWFRIGMTGTVDSKNDERMFRLRAATGDVMAEITADKLINDGYLAKPYIHAIIDNDVYSGYRMPESTVDMDGSAFYKILYDESTVENEKYNSKVADLIEELDVRGQAVLVLITRKKQLRLLSNILRERDLDFFELSGDTPLGIRAEAVETLDREGRGTIVATKIFDIGVDIPALNAVILAAGGRAEISTRQRVGRGLRPKPGENVVHIYDFMNVSHSLLAKHAFERWEIYESENFTIIPEENFCEMLDEIGDASG